MKRRFLFLTTAVLVLVGCAGVSMPRSPGWGQFVKVEGQPEPVPAEWVSTSEGKFAHSIKIPNPVPADSGYRSGMSSEEYFQHLCEKEAGEFVFKTVENVEGFYFMRPPKRPTDYDLMDRYKLEAPEIERFYQLMRPIPAERAKVFINPPWNLYRVIEEPYRDDKQYVRLHGYKQSTQPMTGKVISKPQMRYGLVWRGLKRPKDRELAIAGGEWIVLDLKANEVLAVMRNYGLTGRTPNTPESIWWLNAFQCSNFKRIVSAADKGQQLYDFVSRTLVPIKGESR